MEGRDAKKVGLTPPLDEYIEWLVLYLDSMFLQETSYRVHKVPLVVVVGATRFFESKRTESILIVKIQQAVQDI